MNDLQMRSSVYRTVRPRGSRLPMVLAVTVGVTTLIVAVGIYLATKV